MRYFSILWVLATHTSLYGQTFNAQSQNLGTIKSTEGKFQGTIDVNMELDQAMWHDGNRTKIFGAQQIKELRLQTPNGEQYMYIGLKLDDDYYLFKVISEGKATILFKPNILKDKLAETYYPHYFVLGKKDVPIPLSRKKDFLDVFGEDEKWMAQFIKNNDLNLEMGEEIAKAFNYYNNTFEATHPSH